MDEQIKIYKRANTAKTRRNEAVFLATLYCGNMAEVARRFKISSTVCQMVVRRYYKAFYHGEHQNPRCLYMSRIMRFRKYRDEILRNFYSHRAEQRKLNPIMGETGPDHRIFCPLCKDVGIKTELFALIIGLCLKRKECGHAWPEIAFRFSMLCAKLEMEKFKGHWTRNG